MQIKDMNVEHAILNLELQVGTLLKTVAYISEKNEKIDFPSRAQVEAFKKETINQIKAQYPNNDMPEL